jgi:transmembrane sensor
VAVEIAQLPRKEGKDRMSAPESDVALNPLLVEGLDWVSRMRAADFDQHARLALVDWRGRSAEHEAAYRRAVALGSVLREVSAQIVAEQSHTNVVPLRAKVDRRAFFAGAMAASVAGVVALRSPIRTLFGRAPDYTTGTGEARTIALAPGLTLDLDAQSSITVDRIANRHRVALLAGRTSVDAQLQPGYSVEIVAGKGRSLASKARFEVESDAGKSCVTCVDGAVTVAYGGRHLPLDEGRALRYTDEELGVPMPVDVEEATAWTTGQLIFHHTPLSDVVHQLNRYRHGHVMIINHALSNRPVNGVFHAAQINDAIVQIEQITGARAIHLPGDVVIFA